MAKSSKESLADLHAKLSEVLSDCLVAEGLKLTQPESGGVNPAVLNVARAFLKDNDVTGGADDEALTKLRQQFEGDLSTRRAAAESIAQTIRKDSQQDLSSLMH